MTFPTSCRPASEPGAVLRIDRGLGDRSPSGGRLAHERTVPAQPGSKAMPRRDHRRVERRVRLHRVAVHGLRRQRDDPRLGRHVVEPQRRQCRAARDGAATNQPLSEGSRLGLAGQGFVNRVSRPRALLRISRGLYVRPVHTRFGARSPEVSALLAAVQRETGEVIAPRVAPPPRTSAA